MTRTFAFLIALVWTLASGASASAQMPASYEAWWEEATKHPDAVITDHPDFKLVRCCQGLTYYYFTKPSHPAHPGVIRRAWVKENGGIYSHIDGSSYGSDADQPAFEAWLQQIRDLDEQARIYLGGPSKEATAAIAKDKELGFAARCAAVASFANARLAELKATGSLSPADAALAKSFAKLDETASAELEAQRAVRGGAPSKADLLGAGTEAVVHTPGGSERVARECWSHYHIAFAY